MGKLHADVKNLVAQLLQSNPQMNCGDIARMVTRETGRPTTSNQVSGYRNILLGLANGPKPSGPSFPQIPPAAVPPSVSAASPPPAVPGASAAAAAAAVRRPAGPVADGFASMGGALDDFGAITEPVPVWFEVYRDDAYIGRLNEFSVQQLTDALGDGNYRVDQYYGGRLIGRRTIRVNAGKPTRLMDGRLVAPAAGGARTILEPYGTGWTPPGMVPPMYGGAPWTPYPYGPTPFMPQPAPDPTSQVKNLADVARTLAPAQDPNASHLAAVNASLGFAQQMMAQQNLGNQGVTGWLQAQMAQQAADQKARLEEERARREQDRKDREAEAKIERDRIKAEMEAKDAAREKEYERQRDRDKVFFTQQQTNAEAYFTRLLALHGEDKKRLDEIKKELGDNAKALQAELDEKVGIAQTHYRELYDLERRQLDLQRNLQNELHQEKMRIVSEQRTDGLLGRTLETGLNRLGNSFDRMATLKAVKDLPTGEREVLLKALANQNGNGGIGHNGNGNGHHKEEAAVSDQTTDGGDFRQAAVDKVLASAFFKSLQDEWATYIEAGPEFGPEPFVVLFMRWMNQSPNMATFAAYMIPRPWAKIHELMRPRLSAENAKVFEKKEASDFYEKFRRLLYANMRAAATVAATMNRAATPAPTPT